MERICQEDGANNTVMMGLEIFSCIFVFFIQECKYKERYVKNH